MNTTGLGGERSPLTDRAEGPTSSTSSTAAPASSASTPPPTPAAAGPSTTRCSAPTASTATRTSRSRRATTRSAANAFNPAVITDVTIQVEDPDHVTTRPWQGFDSFRITEEIYRYKGDPRADERLHVVLSLDEESHYWRSEIGPGPAAGGLAPTVPNPVSNPVNLVPRDGHARRQPGRLGEDLRRRTTGASSTRTSATTWRPGSGPTSGATSSPASSGSPSSAPTGPARPRWPDSGPRRTCVMRCTCRPFGTFGDVHAPRGAGGQCRGGGLGRVLPVGSRAVRRAPCPLVDAWVALSAVATSTSRIRLGPLVTPLPRRRPWKVARESVTLDHLSRGRLVLGVGLGIDYWREFSAFPGEAADDGDAGRAARRRDRDRDPALVGRAR